MRKILIISLLFLLPICSLASTTYGPTTAADQLWQIAIFVRPNASVSIAQTMEALQKKNPHAFVDNKLKPGVILQVPTLAEIQSIIPQQIIKKKNDKQIKILLLKFDQQYQDRIADLDQHTLALQNQINNLQNEINKLKQPSQAELFYVNLQDSFGGYGLYVLGTIVAIILLLFIWWICPCRKPKENKEEDTESEYDFMGSNEGIPAKLDLARAYIDMDDKKSARKVLAEVTKKGNKEQQQAAQELLARIK